MTPKEAWIGKFIQYSNGLRAKIIGVVDSGDYLLQDPKSSKQWQAVPSTVHESKIITEEEAVAKFVEIRHNAPQVPFCPCGTWRVGRPNLSMEMPLPQGRLPLDEGYRIEAELDKFFRKRNIFPKVSYSEDGIHLEFFDMNEGD